MAVLVDSNTKVVVQGITGREGSFHTSEMLKYGTNIVAGVTPGKGGTKVAGIPVYNSIREAITAHPEITASIVFVPAEYASDAIYESIDEGINLIVVVTEHIPVHETLRFVIYSKYRESIIVGPNTPGVISPGKAKVGIMPARYFTPGTIGIISRSGTLMYEVSWQLAKHGLGVSTAIGLGGDPVTGLNFIEAMEFFEEDDETEVVILIGEIGGKQEEIFAKAYLRGKFSKPVIAFIAGRSAPPGKKMGHAGAIIMREQGTFTSKVKSLLNSGILVAEKLSDIPKLVGKVLKSVKM